jgi:subtilisin
MLEEFHEPQIGFHRFMRALRSTDEELFNFAGHKIEHRAFQKMMLEVELEKPELARQIQEAVAAMEQGQGERVKVDAWSIARTLAANYDCRTGFKPESEPEQLTVIVGLNIAKPIYDLPRELLALSDTIAKDHGGLRTWTYGFDNRRFNLNIPREALPYLQKHALVDFVEVPPMARIMSNEIPTYNPAIEMTDWGVDRTHPLNAWAKGLYGQNIKLCVIDTGIKRDHQAFWKDGLTPYKGGYNFVGSTSDPADDHDHGTYCCSIICHQHSGLAGRYKGIAPGIDLYVCKVLDAKGSGSYANICAAIDWARTNGMHILSMSLGGSAGTTTLQQACDNAWYAGIILCVAAGNSGPEDNTVGYPAKYQSCIAIAATDYDDNVANFSSRGAEVELAAPGRYITGAWAGFTYTNYVVAGSNNKYMCASGTSAATPHAAAYAALIKCWYPSATNTQIRQWMRDHARDL